jgi:hypothetical protein
MEVMVGMLILTIAIVSASNLLFGSQRTNKTNVQVIKAYYLAVEGLEIARNMRDGNWLNNQGFVSADLWQDNANNTNFFELEEGDFRLNEAAFNPPDDIESFEALKRVAPWRIESDSLELPDGFKRRVFFSALNEDIEDFNAQQEILVRSRVSWLDRGEELNVTLETVLTDWHE